ncbi:hypothetical protein MHYP_G00114700 [Metynnis hypsauchen]
MGDDTHSLTAKFTSIQGQASRRCSSVLFKIVYIRPHAFIRRYDFILKPSITFTCPLNVTKSAEGGGKRRNQIGNVWPDITASPSCELPTSSLSGVGYTDVAVIPSSASEVARSKIESSTLTREANC